MRGIERRKIFRSDLDRAEFNEDLSKKARFGQTSGHIIFYFNHRVLMPNEIPAETRKILKLLKITPPKQVVELAETPQNL